MGNKIDYSIYSLYTPHDWIIHFAFGLSIVRILRPLRIIKKLKEMTDDVKRSIGEMVLTIIFMILFSKFK